MYYYYTVYCTLFSLLLLLFLFSEYQPMRHSIALRHLRSPLAVVTVILSLISHSNAYKNRNSAHSDQFLNRFHLNDDLSDDVDVVHEVDRIYQNHGRYQMTERREYISRGKDKENLGRYPQPYFAEETSEDCSVFPNQTLFEPHFFSCSENSKSRRYVTYIVISLMHCFVIQLWCVISPLCLLLMFVVTPIKLWIVQTVLSFFVTSTSDISLLLQVITSNLKLKQFISIINAPSFLSPSPFSLILHALFD